MRGAIVVACGLVACVASALAHPVVVVDDAGRTVRLAAPARRIVSLAPNITETLFAAGAGPFIVGTTRFSDDPDAARRIPRIGDQGMLDLERIVALKPDLIVAWLHGTSERQLANVRALAIPVYESEPRTLADITRAIGNLGALAGTDAIARRAAASYQSRLDALRKRYSNRPVVPVFYQVWGRPLLTVNGRQIISDAIRVCGGSNVFAQAPWLVPSVAAEAVVAADPEAIVASTDAKGQDALDDWRKLTHLRATRQGNLILLRTKALEIQSPRILEGTAMLCDELDRVRAKRR